MKTIVVNVFAPIPCPAVIEHMHERGIKSAKQVPPWHPDGDKSWAFSVNYDGSLDASTVYMVVGWLLGTAGVAMNTEIDFDVVPKIEPIAGGVIQ